jgi:hypothetical protein
MMPDIRNDDAPSGDASREDRVDEVIASYLEAVERGEAPDPQAYIVQHPDFASELSLFFADRAEFHRTVGQLSPDAHEAAQIRNSQPASDLNQPTLGHEIGDAEVVEPGVSAPAAALNIDSLAHQPPITVTPTGFWGAIGYCLRLVAIQFVVGLFLAPFIQAQGWKPNDPSLLIMAAGNAVMLLLALSGPFHK